MNKTNEQTFLCDVKNHEMEILLNSDIYRHIRFKNPECNAYWFEIITSPNLLVINGDMGTFTFSRLHDMFNFFRMNNDDFKSRTENKLQINLGYWAEKLNSYPEKYKEYDADQTHQILKDIIVDNLDDYSHVDSESEAEELLDSLVFDEGDQMLAQEISNCSELGGDYLECITYSPTYHYSWCCMAIVWAIQQFESYGYLRSRLKEIKSDLNGINF